MNYAGEALRSYITTYGIAELKNNQALIGYIKDICPREKKFINCLTMACNNGLISPLCNTITYTEMQQQMMINNIHSRLMSDVGLSSDVADDFVQSLAYGLKWSCTIPRASSNGNTESDKARNTPELNVKRYPTDIPNQHRQTQQSSQQKQQSIDDRIKKQQLDGMYARRDNLKKQLNSIKKFSGNVALLASFIILSVCVICAAAIFSLNGGLSNPTALGIIWVGLIIDIVLLHKLRKGYCVDPSCIMSYFMFCYIIPWVYVVIMYINANTNKDYETQRKQLLQEISDISADIDRLENA